MSTFIFFVSGCLSLFSPVSCLGVAGGLDVWPCVASGAGHGTGTLVGETSTSLRVRGEYDRR